MRGPHGPQEGYWYDIEAQSELLLKFCGVRVDPTYSYEG